MIAQQVVTELEAKTIESGSATRLLSVQKGNKSVEYTPHSWLAKQRQHTLDDLLDGVELFIDLNVMVTADLFHDIEDAKEYVEANYSARPGPGYPLRVISHYVLSLPKLENTQAKAVQSLSQGEWIDTEVSDEIFGLGYSIRSTY
jgi:hypothetical protein